MMVAYSDHHLAPKGNVPGTIEIGIEAKMAFITFKPALTLAVAFLYMPASGASLAGIPRVYLDYQASLSLGFVPNHELQNPECPCIQHGPALLPKPPIPDPLQVFHRNDVARLQPGDDGAADLVERVSDEAVFLASSLDKVSFARVPLFLQCPPLVPVFLGDMGQDAAPEKLVGAGYCRPFDPCINPYYPTSCNRVLNVFVNDQVKKDFVFLHYEIGRSKLPSKIGLIILRDLETELDSLIKEPNRAGLLGEPDGIASGIQPDRNQLCFGTGRLFAYFDYSLDRLERLGCLDASRTGELGRQTEGFAIRIGFAMQADPIRIGISPASQTDEVECSGICFQGWKDLFGTGLQRKPDCSCHLHIMLFYRAHCSSFENLLENGKGNRPIPLPPEGGGFLGRTSS